MMKEGNLRPMSGGPFSALISTMWPQNIMRKIVDEEDAGEQPEYWYDEFGFIVDGEDGAEPNSSKPRGVPMMEDPQHKLQWQAHLEFSMNSEVEDLTWDKIGHSIPRSDKLTKLVRDGIPHSMRADVWARLSGALDKKVSSKVTYKEVIEASLEDTGSSAKAIEKDLLRTIPNNACFSNMDSLGVPCLRRVLQGLAWLYPDNGYCQGTGMIVAHLLLCMEEEDVFWTMSAIIEDLVPASYFSTNLIGVHADQRVLRQLLVQFVPSLDKLLSEHDIEISLITMHWFMTILAGVIHTKILLRIWDLFFLEGSLVLFKIVIGMLKLKENAFEGITNSADIFNMLSDIPSLIDDADQLLQCAEETAGSLTNIVLETHRKKHLAYLMSEHGTPECGQVDIPRKQVLRRRTYLGRLIFGSAVDGKFEYQKAKNIKQTELVADLRQSILSIMKHFQG